MRIKKYTAESMKSALLQIKQDLGEDAMILKTRKIPKKIFALGAHDEIEVTAAVDDSAPRRPEVPPLQLSNTGVYGPTRRRTTQIPSASNLMHAPSAAGTGRNTGSTGTMERMKPERPIAREARDEELRLMELREDIREAKDLLRAILQTGETTAAGGFAGAWAVLYKRLIDAEVKPDLAKALLCEVKNAKADREARIEKRFVSVLGERFPVSGPITLHSGGPAIVAFVGPTGSGKTTTIAKIAAHYSLSAKKNVSIITADTYRIAAIEQIRAFADIVGIGLQVLFSPSEVREALAACANDDLVLVDTAGRSRRNSVHMKELGDFVAALKPHEIHCVLSAGTKDSDLRETIRRFGECGVNRLLFTKLDETERVGNIYNISAESGIPVSYFTVGQAVPDDIELAQPSRFVQRLWEGGSV